jgi:hypothetical protein
MSLQDVMRKVEDHGFSAEMNLVSGSKAFHKGLRNHPVFRELLEALKEPHAPDRILQQIIELSTQPVQPHFENPFDVALTVYLTALDLHRPDLVRRAAENVSKAPNCWWAAEMSLRQLAHIDLKHGIYQEIPGGSGLANFATGAKLITTETTTALLNRVICAVEKGQWLGIAALSREALQGTRISGTVPWQRFLEPQTQDHMISFSRSPNASGQVMKSVNQSQGGSIIRPNMLNGS